MENIEIWKNIPGFIGLYQASTRGRIKSLAKIIEVTNKFGTTCLKNRKERIMTNIVIKGYSVVNIKHRHYLVHRLVAMSFIANPQNKKEVNHIDGNPSNNNLDNLEWCTRSENMKHADRTGLRKMPNGINHWSFGKRGGEAPNAKKVICVETNKIFDSVQEAAKIKGIDLDFLYRNLSPKAINKTSIRFCL